MLEKIDMIRRKIFWPFKIGGIRLFFLRFVRKVFKTDIRSKYYDTYASLFMGKDGLELGGPSPIFLNRGAIPIYSLAKNVDTCNIKKVSPKVNFICDAVDLSIFSSDKYDFVISAHLIEHLSNPLKALEGWLRVLKNGGVILLVVPNKKGTFDRNRPVTKLDHLISDYQKNMAETDLTHLPEILTLYDWTESFPNLGQLQKEIILELARTSGICRMHHHVFDAELLMEVFNHFGLKVVALEEYFCSELIIVGIKNGETKKA
ncbi:MAG: methyltransferase domain-containing protein [Candidatus Saganbacteria bacterium]|nr:methyltransferase domain-containing protein [Candidatus Saganbacteria bacterium]